MRCLFALAVAATAALPAAGQTVVGAELVAPADMFGGRLGYDRAFGAIRAEIAQKTGLTVVPAVNLGIARPQIDRCAELGSLACWASVTGKRASWILVISARKGQRERADVTAVMLPIAEAVPAGLADDALEDALFARSIALDGQAVIEEIDSWRALGARFGDQIGAKVPRPVAIAAPPPPPPRESSIPTIGGLGLAAAGAAIVIYGLAAPANREICRPECAGGFVTFGEGSGESSGVMIVPLGYSLALAGLGWAASPLVHEGSSASPWVELGLALLLGAATYGISAAAGG